RAEETVDRHQSVTYLCIYLHSALAQPTTPRKGTGKTMAGRLRMVSLIAAAVLLGTGLAATTAAGATRTPASADVLLSKNHPVTAFTTRAGFPAKNAVDGKTSTRWASNSGATQWIAVDLGAPKDIVRVHLAWDAACASAYQLQTSPGNGIWTTIS